MDRRAMILGMAGAEAMMGDTASIASSPAASLAPVYIGAHFQAVPCRDCDVPGYLILLPLEAAATFCDLSNEALAAIGPTFARLERALIAATGCERVYLVRLSEGVKSIHFHVFPRTARLATQFHQEMTPNEATINGELLFYWARKRFRVEPAVALSAQTQAMAERIRTLLAAGGRNPS